MATKNRTFFAIENFSLGACGRTPKRGAGAWNSVELWVSGLAQRPPRVWRRQPAYPQRAAVTVPIYVLANDQAAAQLRRLSEPAFSKF